MAVTVNPTEPNPFQVNGRMREAVVTITGDASYPTNGYPIDPKAIMGLSTVQLAIVPPSSATGLVPAWDYANNKLKLFATGAAANAVLNEVPNATNVSTMVTRGLFRGL